MRGAGGPGRHVRWVPIAEVASLSQEPSPAPARHLSLQRPWPAVPRPSGCLLLRGSWRPLQPHHQTWPPLGSPPPGHTLVVVAVGISRVKA